MVERIGFIQFCKQCLPNYTLISRRTVGRRLNQLYEEHKNKLINTLTSVRWVSCTADLWSAHKRAYLGLTVHFIDDKTLQMCSNVLACRRFRGSHTGEAIGHMLSNLLKEFGISKKTLDFVTDNAPNFAKAFSLFKATTVNEVENHDASDDDDYNNDNDIQTNNEHLEVLDLAQIMDELEEADVDEPITLPQHKRCGNHSLNLVASVDAAKARQDKTYQRAYDKFMAKVQTLSNSVSRSTHNNDIVKEIAGKTFLKPVCTRWCSEYYAVERVVDIGLEKIN